MSALDPTTLALVAFDPQFDFDYFVDRVGRPDSDLWRALWATLYIAVIAQVLGVVLGLISALAQLSGSRVLSGIAGLYVWLIRGTPVVVQIFFVYFGAPLFLGVDLFPDTLGIVGVASVSGAIMAGITALAINEGAYMSEIIRAGITSIDRGQMESAKSVGMTRLLAMRRVVLPQAARVIVPPLGNEFNNMLKTTSLLAFISVYELFQDARIEYANTFKYAEALVAVSIWYLMLTTVWALVQVQIERHLGESDREETESLAARLFGWKSTSWVGAK